MVLSIPMIIREHINTNKINLSAIAEKIGMSAYLLKCVLEEKRRLKADEFVKICLALNLDLDSFWECSALK